MWYCGSGILSFPFQQSNLPEGTQWLDSPGLERDNF